jgi:hypothetical protein
MHVVRSHKFQFSHEFMKSVYIDGMTCVANVTGGEVAIVLIKSSINPQKPHTDHASRYIMYF